MRRRKLLTTIGVGGAAMVGAVGSAHSQTDEFRRDTRRAADIRRRRGRDAAEDFLEEKGYRTGVKAVTRQVPLAEPDGDDDADTDLETLSIDDAQSGGITVELFGVDRSGIMYVLVTIRYEFEAECFRYRWNPQSYGTDPADALGISWNSYQNEYFDLAYGGGSRAMDPRKNGSWNEDLHDPSRGRTAFKIDDQSAYRSWENDLPTCNLGRRFDVEEDDVIGAQCGIYLDPTGDWDPDERVVRASYTHAYGTLAFSPSVSFNSSGPGVSIGPSWRVNTTEVNTSDDGTDLEIYQSFIT